MAASSSAACCAALSLSACSMAGISFKPLPGNKPQMVAKMQVPAETLESLRSIEGVLTLRNLGKSIS